MTHRHTFVPIDGTLFAASYAQPDRLCCLECGKVLADKWRGAWEPCPECKFYKNRKAIRCVHCSNKRRAEFWHRAKPTHGGCLEWQGSTTPAGYGLVRVDGQRVGAHRRAYELAKGPIPEGLTIDHLCRNRRCVNPLHLEAVTMQENLDRGRSYRSVKTACKNGHPFTPDNTRWRGNGRRCRACDRDRDRKRRNYSPALFRYP